MEPSTEVDVDLTSNITEAELDRPGYLPTSVDCIKWAEDGRLAVNLGSMALVYQPHFEGRERYGFTTFSVPCPELDSTVLDLQRFPGKADDFVEFARKGLKYLAADDPDHLTKCVVGGDSNTISNISWSPRGCAWDGGCLLSVATSLHTVTVYQPARESLCDMEWQPLATVSTALLEWGLRVCPTDGARTYRSQLKLNDPGETSGDGQPEGTRRKNGGGGDGFVLAGLWAVARATRTRSAAWMGRRMVPVAVGAGVKGRGGEEGAGRGGGGGGEDFTLLALAADSIVTLWAFSGLTGSAAGGADDEQEEGSGAEEGRSWGLVRERPAWAGDLRALGAGVADGEIKVLAWCHEGGGGSSPPPDTNRAKHSSSLIRDFLAVGTSTGAVFVLKVDIGRGGSVGGEASERGRAEALAMPAAVKAVPFRRVCLPDGSPVTFLSHVVLGEVGGGGGGGRSSGCPGGKGEDADRALPWCSPRSAVAVVKGATVSIFPSVTTATTTSQPGEQPPAATATATAAAAAAAAEAVPAPAPASFAASPPQQQPAPTTWEAHDHNVTGISALPFPAPVSSTAAPCTMAAAPAPSAAAGKTGASPGSGKEGGGRGDGVGENAAGGGGKRRRRQKGAADGGGGGGGGGSGGGGGGAATAAASDGGWSTALIYTCSMDGSCKEWEVGVAGAGRDGEEEGGGKEAAKARLRKLVSGDARRASAPPHSKNPAPLLGCSASPNGVLVASLEFCRPERSTRKAVQHIARKGTHCRIVLTPMVPPATERAATAEGGRESSWNFPLARGALSTDWAWFLRAAILGDAAVHSSRENVGSFSLIPTLQRALEDALVKAAAAAGTTTAAGASGSCEATSGSRPCGLLWDLLRLHHLFVATAASVARCQASVHVPPVADNGDGAAGTDDDDDDDDDEDDDDDDDRGGGGTSDGNEDAASTSTQNGGSGGGGGTGRGKGKGKPKEHTRDGEDEEEEAGARRRSVVSPPAPPAAAPTSQLLMPPTSGLPNSRRPNVKFSSRSTGNNSSASSRPKRPRNETPLDKKAAATMAKVKKIRRLQNAADRVSAAERAARATAAESATRNRLVLLRAWELLRAAASDNAREGSGRVGAGAVSNGGGVDAGSGGAPGAAVLQQHHPLVPDASASAAQRAASERCLRDACWLARSRRGTGASRPGPGGAQPANGAGGGGATGANGVNGGGAGGAAGVGGYLVGPSATPVMDLPREADVQAALSLLAGESDGNQANGSTRRQGGDGSPPGALGAAKKASSSTPSSDDEVCLLCGAPVLKLGSRATVAAAVAAGTRGSDAEPSGDAGSSEAQAPPGESGEKDGNADGGVVEDGGEGGQVGAAEATEAARVLELPGWAVCCRGHRLRRCMDTLAPALGVGYRRCEVCRCVLVSPDSFPGPEGGEGGDGGGEGGRSEALVRGRGIASWMRERSACVFCNVLLSSGSSAVNWLG